LNLRPTEPCLRNSVKFVLKDFEKNYKIAIKHLKTVRRKIAEIGSRLIRDGIVVFTHCHSSTVIEILKMAFKQGKKFEVYNTETRPLYQGRKTARELAKIGIPVKHFVDSAGRIAIKKSDLVLFGADSITSVGKIINKIGTEMFAEIANKYDKPVYFCTDSWKFNPKTIIGFEEKIEERSPKEVWKNPPKGVEILNYAFESVKPELATGIISELGIFKPAVFVGEVKKNYPWIFE